MTSIPPETMAAIPPHGVTLDVSYSVKELFEKVDRKLDRISDQLEGKADRAQVEELERKITSLEQFKWKLIGIGIGAGAAGASGVVGVLKAVGGL